MRFSSCWCWHYHNSCWKCPHFAVTPAPRRTRRPLARRIVKDNPCRAKRAASCMCFSSSMVPCSLAGVTRPISRSQYWDCSGARDLVFFRFVTMHAFDRRTDGRTDGQTDRNIIVRPRLHFTQRGKKWKHQLKRGSSRQKMACMFAPKLANN